MRPKIRFLMAPVKILVLLHLFTLMDVKIWDLLHVTMRNFKSSKYQYQLWLNSHRTHSNHTGSVTNRFSCIEKLPFIDSLIVSLYPLIVFRIASDISRKYVQVREAKNSAWSYSWNEHWLSYPPSIWVDTVYLSCFWDKSISFSAKSSN